MTDRGLLAPLIDEWREARRELAEMERAEHPDIVDHHGRAWTWVSGDLYRHDSMAWTERMVRDGRHGLPEARLADNPNSRLCEICTKEWPR
jgi:xanthine/CO dehydrogenase XdhC/CoxF family maturation factor